MDRQRLLDNFVRATYGKGRAVHPSGADGRGRCAYVLEGHPGCGIGCQPGFREAFGENPRVCGATVGIRTLIERVPEVGEFFGAKNLYNLEHLVSLQILHDRAGHWTSEGTLRREVLEAYCKREGLTVPTVAA